MSREKTYIWEAPVRYTHWINAACMVVLSLTGIYIGSPFLAAGSTTGFTMGWVRFIHFVSAYLLLVSLGVRIYWAFSGNLYASWKSLFPFSEERIGNLMKQMSFYALVSRKPPEEAGHTPLAGITYFFLLLLSAAAAATGFALLSLHRPGGLMDAAFGWVFAIMSVQMTRLVHHLIMWMVIYFTILHLYIVFFLNSVEKNGLISSIFDGYKYLDAGRSK